MTIIVRRPALTDAAGAGMAAALIARHHLGDRVDDAYWRDHGEEAEVQRWHDIFLSPLHGTRIALALTHRRVVGICAMAPVGRNDRSGELAARERELFYFGVLPDFATDDLYQRLLDFVVADRGPVQAWVWRDDRTIRRFLRLNGFTLDGMSLSDPETGLEYSRLVR
ncbi:hypothetical protein H8R18_02410 [Nanchangia anserum]|uniref:N-acetyltransferase domain-containing protein n=1 Tax=Nanchangia anserum TaxID=2692125 RepID=A0A8I0G8R9_9ACTO|nr:hypothetical protein [Nanchangia anserum]MBD3689972.1 hypothetical protein [Nanchangia anserum]QOX82222.1 hypothetical protein H8R18_02410 [Nanchangia anserum]